MRKWKIPIVQLFLGYNSIAKSIGMVRFPKWNFSENFAESYLKPIYNSLVPPERRNYNKHHCARNIITFADTIPKGTYFLDRKL